MCGSGDKVVYKSGLGQPTTAVIFVFYLFLFKFGASPHVYHKSQKHKHKEKKRTDDLLLYKFPQGASPLVSKFQKQNNNRRRNRADEQCTSGVSQTWWKEHRVKNTMGYPGALCYKYIKERTGK